jgi:hypothetical protein
VGKVYNLCRVKTDISALLMVRSSLDPHIIIEFEDKINREPYVYGYRYASIISLLFLLI